jgi:hypothetical protein
MEETASNSFSTGLLLGFGVTTEKEIP